MAERDNQTPTRMPTSNRPQNLGIAINDDASRLDGIAKVTGRAKYGRDIYPDNGLFVRFVRCPYGAATLAGVNEQAALAVPGVLEVNMSGDRGRYNGHVVGYLVAETKHALHRGMRALAPEWQQEDVTTRITATENDAPGVGDATRRLLGQADHVIERLYSTPVQTHSPLETHGASIDWRDDGVTAYVSTQGTFAARDGMGRALDMNAGEYEVICEYVGGGFGSKLNGAGKEGVTAGRVAKKYGRPVYLFCDRAEDHLDTGNRPSSQTLVRIGANKDGRILGGQIVTWGGVGVSRRGGGVAIPSGRYDLGEIDNPRAINVQFNGGAPRAFRAPGHPQAAFAEELMLDEVATAIDMDPYELRQRLDVSETRRAMYEVGAKSIGWDRRQRTGSQTGARRRGFGMGSAAWGRFPAQAEAEVIIHADGTVEARTGSQDIGTGQRTIMGALVADGIGIGLDRVSVGIGRSSYPISPGSGGSMTAHNTAPAMMEAAAKAREKLLDTLADHQNLVAGALEIENGEIKTGGKTLMSFDDACRLVTRDGISARGSRSRESLAKYGGEGNSDGVQFAEVEVDTETGVIRVVHIVAVQACGKVVVRKTAESQIIGGVIQGLSYALFEDKILDRNVGAMVNPNLEMYKIAGTDDMPHIEPVLWADGQTGVRSLGEPPTIPTAGAIACAVYNAIGVPVTHLPLTPDKVLAALEGGAA